MASRVIKLNAEFKKHICQLLATKVKDPRLTEMYTILSVDCDRELDTARVYVSIFSTNERRAAETFVALVDSQPYLRSQISRAMHIRTVPEFRFVLDTTMAYSQKISEIINEINKNNNSTDS